jgi:hypothetical protein
MGKGDRREREGGGGGGEGMGGRREGEGKKAHRNTHTHTHTPVLWPDRAPHCCARRRDSSASPLQSIQEGVCMFMCVRVCLRMAVVSRGA